MAMAREAVTDVAMPSAGRGGRPIHVCIPLERQSLLKETLHHPGCARRWGSRSRNLHSPTHR
eukprot:scaffold231277_cov33-Tisochrysis_lutea.AAC.1